MITVYHNPRCSKSRQALAWLEEAGAAHQVHLYLEEGMPRDVLKKAIETLGEKVMVRTGEAEYKEHIKNKGLNLQELVDVMLAYPKTIERPLCVKGAQMVMARPAENLDILLS